MHTLPRPRFLVVGLLCAAAVLGLWLALTPRGYEADLAALERRYDIDIVAKPDPSISASWNTIGFEYPTDADLDAYAPMLREEFSRYPNGLVARTMLRRIVLATNLSISGQRRNAIPDLYNRTLYLETRRGMYAPTYMRRVIHHEFFHLMDAIMTGRIDADPHWASLNSPGFQYGRGGSSMLDDPLASRDTEDVPGFLNRYATAAVEEDKAEVFARLMTEPLYLSRRAESDSILRAKIDRTKSILADFCSEMSAQFWLANERRSGSGKAR